MSTIDVMDLMVKMKNKLEGFIVWLGFVWDFAFFIISRTYIVII